MRRLSKDERKRLRREAEHRNRIQEFCSHVVSRDATIHIAGPLQIVADARTLGVNLAHRPIDDVSHAFGVPNEDGQFVVVVTYGNLTREILSEADDYEWLFRDASALQIGLPTITYRAKVCLDPVIDFLHETMIRVLGRLTHGILISGTVQDVSDDWLSWSGDYLDKDMFKVTQVCNYPSPDFQSLLERFPQLRAGYEHESRCDRFGAVIPAKERRRPWWKIW